MALEKVMSTIHGMISLTISRQLERKRQAIKDRVTNVAEIDDKEVDKHLLPCEISRFELTL